ncbi:MAG: IclR family transcriptional regulator [Acetobacteraceae bacterium]
MSASPARGGRRAAGAVPRVRVAPARIQSVARAAALLEGLAHGDWVGLGELAAATGLAKTTAFSLVTALVDTGLAERDAARGAYRLGLRHFGYGKAVERRLELGLTARPVLLGLLAETNETVNLAIPQPTDALIVESLEGAQGVRVTSYAGTRARYHCTACGRVLFAHKSLAERQAIYALGPLTAATAHTTTAPEAIERLLARCRRDGFAAEREENELGAHCVAAPVFGPAGGVIAAVSVAGPKSRMDLQRIERIGRLLKERLALIFDRRGEAVRR